MIGLNGTLNGTSHSPHYQPRPYQTKGLHEIRCSIVEGDRRPLYVLSTGGGKGSMFAHMIQGAAAKGKRVVFLVGMRSLVADMSERLDNLGVAHGVIMGKDSRDPWRHVQVCSIQTLHRRRHLIQSFDLALIDEADLSLSKTWKAVVDAFGDIPVIGCTATPCRTDGRGLGEMFNRLILGPPMKQLIADGFLSPVTVWSVKSPDVSGIKRIGGEFNLAQLEALLDEKSIMGSLVDSYKRITPGLRAITFCVSLRHSIHTMQQFNAAGIPSAHIDADTPLDERKRIIAQLKNKDILNICSVGCLTTGVDMPWLEVGIDGAPTMSLRLHRQKLGRLTRVCPGKNKGIWIDAALNVARHAPYGFPEDEPQWTLEGIPHKPKLKPDESDYVAVCPKCSHTYRRKPQKCTATTIGGKECGYLFSTSEEREIIQNDKAVLEEITAEDKAKYTIRKLSDNPKVALLQRKAAAEGRSPGWVWYQAKQMGISLGRR